jgi:hypothetical protein
MEHALLAIFLTGTAVVTGASAAPPAADLCRIAQQALPAPACIANEHGVVLSHSADDARRLAEYLAAGERRFQRHFGATPPRYALAQGYSAAQMKLLSEAGFTRPLAWFTAERQEESALASVRRATEQQAKERGVPPERLQQALAAAEQAWRAANPATWRHSIEAGAIPHELGHIWYVEHFWPGARLDSASHYGGPGPDWLDETAAVLMEDEFMTNDRRDQFRRAYRGDPGMIARLGDRAGELTDLRLFLTRDHPMKAVQQELLAKSGGQAQGITILTGEEARRVSAGGILLYLQARAFADFLIDRTDDPAVFAQIGSAFGRGESVEQWLQANGAKLGLGATITELDANWKSWLNGRFGRQGQTAR